MTNIQVSVDKLQKIRDRLPYGAIKQIAGELGLSHEFTSAVLRGRRRNNKVIYRALEIIKEQEDRKQEFENQIDQVV